jgi:hypothetical protein
VASNLIKAINALFFDFHVSDQPIVLVNQPDQGVLNGLSRGAQDFGRRELNHRRATVGGAVVNEIRARRLDDARRKDHVRHKAPALKVGGGLEDRGCRSTEDFRGIVRVEQQDTGGVHSDFPRPGWLAVAVVDLDPAVYGAHRWCARADAAGLPCGTAAVQAFVPAPMNQVT